MDATPHVRDDAVDRTASPAPSGTQTDRTADYHSDVTPERVALMRERARTAMEAEEWEQVDGFGTTSHS